MGERDVLKEKWCCFVCQKTFEFGKLICGPGTSLLCPTCKTENIHPANGSERILAEYNGEKGTIQ